MADSSSADEIVDRWMAGVELAARLEPISDHTDVTWEQLQELVDRMVTDGRIPRTGTHSVRVVTPTSMVRCETVCSLGYDCDDTTCPGWVDG